MQVLLGCSFYGMFFATVAGVGSSCTGVGRRKIVAAGSLMLCALFFVFNVIPMDIYPYSELMFYKQYGFRPF